VTPRSLTTSMDEATASFGSGLRWWRERRGFSQLDLSENPPAGETRAPVLIIHFKSKETSLRLFTTIATLGTPHDVTLQEIRVECFFPMDDATAQVFRDWACGTGGPA